MKVHTDVQDSLQGAKFEWCTRLRERTGSIGLTPYPAELDVPIEATVSFGSVWIRGARQHHIDQETRGQAKFQLPWHATCDVCPGPPSHANSTRKRTRIVRDAATGVDVIDGLLVDPGRPIGDFLSRRFRSWFD
ncbi:hypothetical protein UVI_02030950 [Ustilaginoidea virens]|uniref:Uncharacterized protein n=1 Tax=Ustilaginoidea virens TaxID=1159556 RepID=A0A1B5L2A7_USTVR|nr:hypothetical protein UVI_02030950 [Ustilaginoidea virens]